ncbi:MAG: hypothetical protein SFU84_13875 [Gemmatimonadales bacterium]|nr:hypothetical protein [Gemmatimonadales bacterium]
MRYLSALALSLLAAAPAAAQVTAEPLSALRSGAHLRVALAGDLVNGRFATVTPSTLTITTDSGPRAIPLQNITTVWERKRHGARGALIGGVIGAAAFTGFLHLIVSAFCETSDGCAKDHRRAWGYGIVIGGAGGGLVGAGIGSLFTRWEQRAP